jgi:prepilin-type N-terminal cleavage/methylation domain-containing protein
MRRASEEARPGGAGRHAFSLVEVVVALAILLILLPLSTPLYDQFVKDAREQALRQRLAQVRRQFRLFYQDHRRFPNLLFDQFGNQVDLLDNRYSELVEGVHDGPAGHYPLNRRRYLAEVPVDPFSGRADWVLVRADTISDPIASRRPMQTETSTRQLSSRRRSITSGTIELLNNIQEVTGLVTIMDVKSRTPGYEDY